ncbi:MAG: hypothetical protein ACRD3J_07195 [Thermoanaerobaculia bacterium]
MSNKLIDLAQAVTDEPSFVRFLTALLEDCQQHDRDCQQRWSECAMADHWQTRSTKDFLASIEEWAREGDFGQGEHHGEPILRRVATMLYVGRHFRPEDRPEF